MSKQEPVLLDVAKDFSPRPSGRTRADGKFSAERFREDFLIPYYNDSDILEINLDGVEVMSAAFLEEAFGGLAAQSTGSLQTILGKMRIVSRRRSYILTIKKYIQEALDRHAEPA